MEIVNLSGWNPPEGFVNVIEDILRGFEIDTEGITVAFVTGDYMAELKERFFGERRTTDVLTFVYDDVKEVVICPSHLNYDPHEIVRRVFHGILHAIGYDHKVKSKAPKMERLESELMKAFRERYGNR